MMMFEIKLECEILVFGFDMHPDGSSCEGF